MTPLRLAPPCEAEQEACIRPLRPRKPDSYYLADIATSCVPLDDGTDTPDPVIVAEFLSSDDRKDRGAKLDDYRDLPTVMAVLLFDQKRFPASMRLQPWGARQVIDQS